MARTDAHFTAAALEKIMLQNGSVVLYVCSSILLLLLSSYDLHGHVMI